jgi:hypothetical protein
MHRTQIGEACLPYDENDLGRGGSRRPVTRGLEMGLTHPVVGRMARHEMGRCQTSRPDLPDSDRDS